MVVPFPYGKEPHPEVLFLILFLPVWILSSSIHKNHVEQSSFVQEAVIREELIMKGLQWLGNLTNSDSMLSWSNIESHLIGIQNLSWTCRERFG